MPAYYNARDVLKGVLPGLSERETMAKSAAMQSNADIIIPESKYNNTFVAAAKKATKATGNDMGERNAKLRGIEAKDETYATLQIVKAGNVDAGEVFSDFLLQSAQEASQEKVQLIETFGETVGFFYGDRPKIYQYAGTLTNTKDYPWKDRWKQYYETTLRGTKLVEAKKRAYLTYDFVLREGYILSFNMQQSSANPNHLDFNFSMFITKETNLNPTDMDEYRQDVSRQLVGAFESGLNGAIPTFGSVLDAIQDNNNNSLKTLREEMSDEAYISQMGTTVDIIPPPQWPNASMTYPELLPNVNRSPYVS